MFIEVLKPIKLFCPRALTPMSSHVLLNITIPMVYLNVKLHEAATYHSLVLICKISHLLYFFLGCTTVNVICATETRTGLLHPVPTSSDH